MAGDPFIPKGDNGHRLVTRLSLGISILGHVFRLTRNAQVAVLRRVSATFLPISSAGMVSG